MQDSNKSVFRQGVVFGFGFLIPLFVGVIAFILIGNAISKSRIDRLSNHSDYRSEEERNINFIEVKNFKDYRDENFVMVTGSIKNNSDHRIGSIKLEAEFFDAHGDFVYEETEYISKTLASNEVENFAIKCGCSNRKIPEYAKVTVRVVSVSGY
jgi:hypothetical protein